MYTIYLQIRTIVWEDLFNDHRTNRNVFVCTSNLLFSSLCLRMRRVNLGVIFRDVDILPRYEDFQCL